MGVEEFLELDVIAVFNRSNCVNTEKTAKHFFQFILRFGIVKIHIVPRILISIETGSVQRSFLTLLPIENAPKRTLVQCEHWLF